MRKLVYFVATFSVGIFLTYPIAASAHGKDSHDDHADAQMHKLHHMMPMFSVASAELENAIGRGDATAVKAQTEKILAALPDLKESKPHKNLKQLPAFKKIVAQFGDEVSTVRKLAEKGDFGAAKEAFGKLESRCAECHAKFRD